MGSNALQQLRESDRLFETVAIHCDVVLRLRKADTVWFSLDPPTDVTVFGRDPSGGLLLACGESGVAAYVSSEGSAGQVGANIDSFLGLVLALPKWLDVLHFSGGGKLSDMRRANQWLLSGDSERESRRQTLSEVAEEVGLLLPPDPVKALWTYVRSTPWTVRGPDGNPHGTLFNTFTAP